MNEQQTRKGDFTPKYLNGKDIYADETLTKSERTRELVKHYATCLFGLATDMATEQQKIIDKRLRYVQLENENKELRAVVRQLQIATKTKSTADVDKLKQRIANLKTALRAKKANEASKRPKRISDLTSEERQAIRADYYDKRIVALQQQVKYWRDKYKKTIGNDTGGDNGK